MDLYHHDRIVVYQKKRRKKDRKADKNIIVTTYLDVLDLCSNNQLGARGSLRGHPRMGEDLGGRWSLLGLHIQHQPYEVLDKNNDDTDTMPSSNECIQALGTSIKKGSQSHFTVCEVSILDELIIFQESHFCLHFRGLGGKQ